MIERLQRRVEALEAARPPSPGRWTFEHLTDAELVEVRALLREVAAQRAVTPEERARLVELLTSAEARRLP